MFVCVWCNLHILLLQIIKSLLGHHMSVVPTPLGCETIHRTVLSTQRFPKEGLLNTRSPHCGTGDLFFMSNPVHSWVTLTSVCLLWRSRTLWSGHASFALGGLLESPPRKTPRPRARSKPSTACRRNNWLLQPDSCTTSQKSTLTRCQAHHYHALVTWFVSKCFQYLSIMVDGVHFSFPCSMNVLQFPLGSSCIDPLDKERLV